MIPDSSPVARSAMVFVAVCVASGLLLWWWTSEVVPCGVILLAAVVVLKVANRLGA